MFTILMIGMPCIGFLYTFFGAFNTSNESRRNYYRAHLAWLCFAACLYASLFAVGMAPTPYKIYKRYLHEMNLAKRQGESEDSIPKMNKKMESKQNDAE